MIKKRRGSHEEGACLAVHPFQSRGKGAAAARRNLYWQLRQNNDALGIPTESADQLLGADAPALAVQGRPVQ